VLLAARAIDIAQVDEVLAARGNRASAP
jgi:hypothetical protein